MILSKSAVRRIIADYRSMENNTSVFFKAVDRDNMVSWLARIQGPIDSDWEGGEFWLLILYPQHYPNVAPKVRFVGEIPFHPNIYTTGEICLNMLQADWSASYFIENVLEGVRSLLTAPNVDSPANADASKLYSQDYLTYRRHVLRCVEDSLMLTNKKLAMSAFPLVKEVLGNQARDFSFFECLKD